MPPVRLKVQIVANADQDTEELLHAAILALKLALGGVGWVGRRGLPHE